MGSALITSSNHDGLPDLKTITYRGGIVTFRIPTSWIEEYDKEGCGVFYEDAEDSGTLRVNIFTSKAPDHLGGNLAVIALQSIRKAENHPIEELDNGKAIMRYSEPAEEDGVSLLVTYWIIAIPVAPNHVRFADFSYTISEFARSDPRVTKDKKLLDHEFRNAVFD